MLSGVLERMEAARFEILIRAQVRPRVSKKARHSATPTATMYPASLPCSFAGSKKEYAVEYVSILGWCRRSGRRSAGVIRTVEALRGMGDVCDAEVTCEHGDANREVPPWTRAGVGEYDLEQCITGVHSVLGDVEPCYTADH